MSENNERIDKFLEELSELTKKYRIAICGCGCCGSPWLNDMVEDKDVGDDLYFDDNQQKYTYD